MQYSALLTQLAKNTLYHCSFKHTVTGKVDLHSHQFIKVDVL